MFCRISHLFQYNFPTKTSMSIGNCPICSNDVPIKKRSLLEFLFPYFPLIFKQMDKHAVFSDRFLIETSNFVGDFPTYPPHCLVSPEGHDGHGLADHLLIPWAAITGDPDVWWVSVGLNQYYMCKQLYIYIYIYTYIYIYIHMYMRA